MLRWAGYANMLVWRRKLLDAIHYDDVERDVIVLAGARAAFGLLQ